jgi:hypothetical protein
VKNEFKTTEIKQKTGIIKIILCLGEKSGRKFIYKTLNFALKFIRSQNEFYAKEI